MHLDQKKLAKIVIISFILSIVTAVTEVVSLMGVYNCQTTQCVNHDAGNFKLSAFHVTEIFIWVVFLVSLAMLIAVSIKRKN